MKAYFEIKIFEDENFIIRQDKNKKHCLKITAIKNNEMLGITPIATNSVMLCTTYEDNMLKN